jgi:hypothetical protein
MSHERIEQQLYDIDNNLSNIATILDRIATVLESIAPQGSERERIALGIYSANTIGADAAFEYADEWLAELHEQRAKQKGGN